MKKRIDIAKAEHRGDYLNEVLYKMCKNKPAHKDVGVVYGKLAIIGRTYAAALERTSKKGHAAKKIFSEAISTLIGEEELDKLLAAAKKVKLPTSTTFTDDDYEAIHTVLAAHSYLNKVLQKAAKTSKRSLSSKYLHFHLPNLYPIYDSYSVKNIIQLIPSVRNGCDLTKHDEKYAKFFIRSLVLKNTILDENGENMTFRQLDNLLLKKEPLEYA